MISTTVSNGKSLAIFSKSLRPFLAYEFHCRLIRRFSFVFLLLLVCQLKTVDSIQCCSDSICLEKFIDCPKNVCFKLGTKERYRFALVFCLLIESLFFLLWRYSNSRNRKTSRRTRMYEWSGEFSSPEVRQWFQSNGW